MDSSAFFLELLLKLVLNIEYAVERCFVNGRIVNKMSVHFLAVWGKYISGAAKVTHYEPWHVNLMLAIVYFF